MTNTPGRWHKFLKNSQQMLKSLGNWLSQMIDKVIYSSRLTVITTFIIALIFCLATNFEDLTFRFVKSNETTFNMAAVPVEVIMDEDNYEVTGIPSTVDLSVSGDPADIQLMRTQNTVSVKANLRNMSEGVNVIPLEVTGIPSGVTVSVNPSTVQATITKKQTKTFFITPDILLGPGQSANDFETPHLSATSVSIKATKDKLDSIRTVKAVIDASGHSGEFTVTAPLVAYDSTGKQVSIEMTPETVSATLKTKENVKITTSNPNGTPKTDEDTNTDGQNRARSAAVLPKAGSVFILNS